MRRLYGVILLISLTVSCNIKNYNDSQPKVSNTTSSQKDAYGTDRKISVPIIEMKTPPLELNQNSGNKKSDLLIPTPKDALIVPHDFLIGSLQNDTILTEAYLFVREELEKMWFERTTLSNSRLSDLPKTDQDDIVNVLTSLHDISEVRIGGGRNDGENQYSFVFRMIGKDRSVSGVIYIRKQQKEWQFEDISINRDQYTEFDPVSYRHFL